MDRLSDTELMALVKEGDYRAFDVLYHRYRGPVLRFLFALTWDAQEVSLSCTDADGSDPFAGIRANERVEPDVVMVGELPDAETARLCVQLALIGQGADIPAIADAARATGHRTLRADGRQKVLDGSPLPKSYSEF